ncbi:hypothetical protein [Helicobacter sp. 23-1045]
MDCSILVDLATRESQTAADLNGACFGRVSSRARIRGSLKNPRSMDELVLSSLEFFGTTHESIARYFRTGRFFLVNFADAKSPLLRLF